jgi:hypothetical protein
MTATAVFWDAKNLPASFGLQAYTLMERHFSDGLCVAIRAEHDGKFSACIWNESIEEIGDDYVTTDDPRDAYAIVRALVGHDIDSLHRLHATLLGSCKEGFTHA